MRKDLPHHDAEPVTDRLPLGPMAVGTAARTTSARGGRRLLVLGGVVAAVLGSAVFAFAAGQASGPGVAEADDASLVRAEADRVVCADFNARGGTYYQQFVTKIMGKDSGYKSVSVDVATLQRGIDDLERVGDTAPRAGAGTAASPALEQERATVTSAAAALGQLYANADTTTLLTAFVGTAVECAKLGHQPTWFDAQSLTNGTADSANGSPGGSVGTVAPATGSTSGTASGRGSVAPAAPARPATTFTAGTYEVGSGPDRIAPGTYKATCLTNGYWARMSSTDSSDIISNDWKPNGGPMVVTVKKSDAAVELGDCSWTKTK